MRTTPEIDRKVRKAIGVEENPFFKEEDTEKALQTIDNQVSAEQRKSLFIRIKEFARRIFNKTKDNNHKER